MKIDEKELYRLLNFPKEIQNIFEVDSIANIDFSYDKDRKLYNAYIKVENRNEYLAYYSLGSLYEEDGNYYWKYVNTDNIVIYNDILFYIIPKCDISNYINKNNKNKIIKLLIIFNNMKIDDLFIKLELELIL